MVAGGGPSGLAVAAARQGADVLLLEQTGALGGMGTSGLVPMFAPTSDRRRMIHGGVYAEVVSDMCRRMGNPPAPDDWEPIDPEILKRVCDDLLEESGARLFLDAKHCAVEEENGQIAAVLCATSMGSWVRNTINRLHPPRYRRRRQSLLT